MLHHQKAGIYMAAYKEAQSSHRQLGQLPLVAAYPLGLYVKRLCLFLHKQTIANICSRSASLRSPGDVASCLASAPEPEATDPLPVMLPMFFLKGFYISLCLPRARMATIMIQ